MSTDIFPIPWQAGPAPIAVVMISLNEGSNMDAVCRNLANWAQEVFLVDSYSRDDTVNIALRHGVQVVQRRFRGFGEQWNFALGELPITAPWTMKLDPDERLSDELKASLLDAMRQKDAEGFSFDLRLWFMGKRLPVRQRQIRVWRSGACHFTDVSVNEYPVVKGCIRYVTGHLEHLDSPDLDHWLEKQNRYTTGEAIASYKKSALSDVPKLFGTQLQRRMWLKKNFHRVPMRYPLLFLYYFIVIGTWRAGWAGYAWARLRADVMRLIHYKRREMEITGRLPARRVYGPGEPDERVRQYE